MGSKTGIQWTDATWNPILGCSRVSEGCRHCYAETIAGRFGRQKDGTKKPTVYDGLTQIVNGKPVWTGKIAETRQLLNPLRWKKPRRIFVNSMSDLFHENVTGEQRDRIFAVMALCQHHVFQVLTKRPERMKEYFDQINEEKDMQRWVNAAPAEFPCSDAKLEEMEYPLPNVWLGVSVENQAAADARIPLLLETPAAVRFLSCEPLLGPINLRVRELDPDFEGLGWNSDALMETDIWDSDDGVTSDGPFHPAIDWVIVGGESGPDSRPMHPDWARSLRDQCVSAGVPFFFKQWGEWIPTLGQRHGLKISKHRQMQDGLDMALVSKKAAGAELDGQEWHQFPKEAR